MVLVTPSTPPPEEVPQRAQTNLSIQTLRDSIEIRVNGERPRTDSSLETLPPRGSTPGGVKHKIKNVHRQHWGDLLRIQNSVLPKVIIESLMLATWSALVCIFYNLQPVDFLRQWKIPNSMLLVTILGTAMGLLLVFRVNSAYDRFWEGRKTWSNIHYSIRNLARLIWVYCEPKTEEEALQRICVMNLLIAFASATKHALRDEPSHLYADLQPFLAHLQEFAPTEVDTRGSILPIPLQVTFHIQNYLNQFPTILFPSTSTCNLLTDCLTTFQRIRRTPIPLAYQFHLQQTVLIYLLSLPFQLVASPLGWFTIPVTFLSALVMLGIESIAGEIENPFGYDLNDLPQDDYCEAIRDEIFQMVQNCDTRKDSKGWIAPVPLSFQRISQEKLVEATSPAIKAAEMRRGSEDSADLVQKGWMAGVKGTVDKFVASVVRV
ncbi:Bestrophin, RFP-TM, chloride channel-domain-containing protein [Obelidium mucronatum]|nr:Bestrophin, RFP-TM, chloride channel-domain-containing protein [Obelidium mucronatum]